MRGAVARRETEGNHAGGRRPTGDGGDEPSVVAAGAWQSMLGDQGDGHRSGDVLAREGAHEVGVCASRDEPRREQIDRERDRIRNELFGGPLSAEPLLPTKPPDNSAGAGTPQA